MSANVVSKDHEYAFKHAAITTAHATPVLGQLASIPSFALGCHWFGGSSRNANEQKVSSE